MNTPVDLVWYYLDTGYACGGIQVNSTTGVIVDGAPIFRSLIGKRIATVATWAARLERLRST